MRPFSHFHIFSLFFNLTSDDIWPWYMTFVLINKWGFPCCIYDPTLVEIHQSMWKIGPFSHFQPIFKLDLRWPLTLTYDIWPHQQMRVPMLYLWPIFGWNPSKHVEDIAKCKPFSQQTTTTVDKAYVSFLLRQATQKHLHPVHGWDLKHTFHALILINLWFINM